MGFRMFFLLKEHLEKHTYSQKTSTFLLNTSNFVFV